MFRISLPLSFLFLLSVLYSNPLSFSHYSNEVGMQGVKFSAITYCPESQIADWSCKWCQDYPQFELLRTYWDPDTSVFGYFGRLDNMYVLAFEGSQDWKDWLVNSQVIVLVPYKQYPEAKVHSGFWKAYNDVKSQIYASISTHNVTDLFITGHSLGGAMATIASLDLLEDPPQPLNIFTITYGAPRVGNREYSALFSQFVKNHYRVTHAKDFVVHLPQLFLGYYHTGHEVYYPDDTLHYIECPQAEDSHCARGTTSWPWDTSDHGDYLNVVVAECFSKVTSSTSTASGRIIGEMVE